MPNCTGSHCASSNAAGSEPGRGAIIADHLIEANLRGHDSHGVGLIPNYLQHLAGGTVVANGKGRVVSESGSLIVYDGERAWGQIAAREATMVGIAKARETGVAVVALRNPHHIGRVGTYGEMCAAAGLVSFHFVNVTDARPAVAPWRGTDARFSTNPVCIAMPGPEPDGRSSSTWRRVSSRWARCGSPATRASS